RTHFHELGGQCGVHHQRHEERAGQGDHEGDGHELHELTHHAGPEEQGHEDHHRGGGGGHDGQGDLADAEARGLHGRLPIAHVAVDVLHYDDAIVHQATQRQDQREEHHHVQRYAEEVEQGEGDEHAQGDGKPHEERIAQAQEEHEHAHHEDHPENDVVEQFAHAEAGVLALVTGDGDDEVL